MPAAGGSAPPGAAGLTFAAGDVRLELRIDRGKLADQSAEARKRGVADFARYDANADAALEPRELGDPRAQHLRQIVSIADRDGDGKLSGKEFAAWLDLQERVAKAHVLLTVLDLGCGLFEELDADHDGSLSIRELRTAWRRLNAAGCVVDHRFARARIPRHLLATLSHGLPLTALGTAPRRGPDWFQAMDRNGDGDVSRREFIGTDDVFDRFDRDQDGLVSAEEAESLRPSGS
jgi:Ca2+-binding EF-hand superfamily protein